MITTLSEQACHELWQAAEDTAQLDPFDRLDVTWRYPPVLGTGSSRLIQLREGLELEIFDAKLHNHVRVESPDRPSWLCYHFHLWGYHEDKYTTAGDRTFTLYGGGLAPQQVVDAPPQTALEVTVSMHPELLQAFVGDDQGQIPPSLQHLIRPIEQAHYTRVGRLTPAIAGILWQIVRCSKQGLTKRMYLEAKALELVSWVLEQESAVQTGQQATPRLNADILERIHYAKTLLLRDVHNPPSLPQLAQQAQLNEYALKRNFKQVFGTTVFAYLQDYRLAQARQLFEGGHMSVAEVMLAVGLSDRQYFAAAFRKKFGISPRDCLMQFKQSR
jgi:AraC-like DNA-binding protein